MGLLIVVYQAWRHFYLHHAKRLFDTITTLARALGQIDRRCLAPRDNRPLPRG